MPQESDLSDIISTFGDLQELLVEQYIPVSETDNLVAISVDSIVARVVLYLAPTPNTVECD